MAEVALCGVSKRWGAFVAVDRFDLEVADGEFVVFLGPSGCGKTTTMRMIAGLEDPSAGEISIGGRVVNRLEPKDRDVAMVFQSYGLYPNLSVYENIRFPLKVRRADAATHDARVRKAAAMMELSDLLDRLPRELSGGQRQRVALARAIVREPALFLMDEPLSNLDAKLRVSTRAHLKHLHHTLGVTTIYVTHDQVEAMTLADRIVVMSKGKVQQVGTPAEVYDQPANLFVAGFIGSPGMNLLEGAVDGNGRFVGQNVDAALSLPAPPGPAVLGFRAEDAELVADDGAPCDLVAPVFSVELLGDATMVTIEAGGTLAAVRAPKGYRTAIDATARIRLRQGAAMLFDRTSGQRIAPPPGAASTPARPLPQPVP